MSADPAKMAFRELPPGTWSQLYVLYQAHCLSLKEDPSSRSVFYRATKTWRKCLKFRKKSQHSLCLICDRLKARMRHSRDFMDHASSADALLGHLTMTWRCREKYWEARALSRSKGEQLCLIVDGYDKSKPCLPRWGLGRAPKGQAFVKHPRTGMQISAVLAHGWGCAIFMSPEHVSCGGSYTWETLLLTMNMVWRQCAQEGRPAPKSRPGKMFWICPASKVVGPRRQYGERAEERACGPDDFDVDCRQPHRRRRSSSFTQRAHARGCRQCCAELS